MIGIDPEVMPPDGYTTVTIPEETAEKLATLMVSHGLDSMAGAITYAVDLAQADDETIADADLAKLLHQRLSQ